MNETSISIGVTRTENQKMQSFKFKIRWQASEEVLDRSTASGWTGLGTEFYQVANDVREVGLNRTHGRLKYSCMYT
jgi:hypothetical protein